MLTRSIAVCAFAAAAAPAQIAFVDATDAAGLGGIDATRLCFADLNADGRPDVIVRHRTPGEPDRYRVFLNTSEPANPRFTELDRPDGLPTPESGDCLVFADLDNDGLADAVFTRYLDVNNESFAEPASHPARTAWLKGHGDGTFGEPRMIEAAARATTAAVAVGDVDRNGRLDLYLGNWYLKYGAGVEAFDNELLMQAPLADGVPRFDRVGPGRTWMHWQEDSGARPTYGVLIADLLRTPEPKIGGGTLPQLVELNYGRRWNGLLVLETNHSVWRWEDHAPALGLDGDEIRHGLYPDWLKDLAKSDPRFDREDEEPFRANGNTFDAAVGDIDNDGLFDLFLAEITHAWAGESSDRSRFLVQQRSDGSTRFVSPPELSVDRIPPVPPREDWAALGTPEKPWSPRWNQGDLFCELADLDHDGRLDLILSSGDYPDPPPFDQRLRIFRQRGDGSFEDVTAGSGIDHAGSQQISLADVDGDGDLDILVGQAFNRFTPEQIAERGLGDENGRPRLRLFLNRASDRRPGSSITLRLVGDPERGCARDALGAIVRIVTGDEADDTGESSRQVRQLVGIGGHAGKQHEFLIHFGLGPADRAREVAIEWPCAEPATTTLRDVAAGRYVVRQGRGAAEPARR